MDWRPWVLVGLGSLAILWAVNRGPPWTGGLVAGILFRAGIIYLGLAATTVWVGAVTLRRAIKSAIATLMVAALTGLVTLYYAEVVTEPPSLGQESMLDLVLMEVTVAFLLLPIPAGYVGGILRRQGRSEVCVGVVYGTIVGGCIVAVIVAIVSGIFTSGGEGAEGLLMLFFLLTSIAAGVAAVPPLVLMNRGHPRAPTPGE